MSEELRNVGAAATAMAVIFGALFAIIASGHGWRLATAIFGLVVLIMAVVTGVVLLSCWLWGV